MQRRTPEGAYNRSGCSPVCPDQSAQQQNSYVTNAGNSSMYYNNVSGGGFPNNQMQSPRSFPNNYGTRLPQMPAQSTPIHPRNLPSQHQSFGSQIDYNLNWMPSNDMQLNDFSHSGQFPSGQARRNPNMAFETNSTIDSNYLGNVSQINRSGSPQKNTKTKESLIEWFDRTVESELRNRRECSLNVGENLVNLDSPTHLQTAPMPSTQSNPLLMEASTSGIEISARLRKDQDTQLLDAVDKLAKAEAMIAFEGAVRAAEQAAAAAPPEFAEEAAAAGAQDFQAELTGVVKHQFEGAKPIEVVGYVGITRPKIPRKPNSSNNN